MKVIPVSIVSFLLGAIISYYAFKGGNAEAPVDKSATEQQGELETINDKYDDLAREHSEVELKYIELLQEVEVLKAKLSVEKPVAKVEKKEESNPFLEMSMNMGMSFVETAQYNKLEKLKLNLSLTPSQEERVRAYIAQDIARQQDEMMKFMSGEMSVEEITENMRTKNKKGDSRHLSMNALLEEILTKEQNVLYDAYKEKEKAERVEAKAYQDLAALQQDIHMTEEQKDAVLEVFYDEDFDVSPEEWEELVDIKKGMDQFIEKSKIQNQKKLDALSEILNGDQLDLYKRKLDQELQAIEMSHQMLKE